MCFRRRWGRFEYGRGRRSKVGGSSAGAFRIPNRGLSAMFQDAISRLLADPDYTAEL